jgi:hypothetical protein
MKDLQHPIHRDDYVRVSTILARYTDYSTVPTNVLDYAADRGTRIHKFCELYSLGMLFEEIDFDCIEYVQAYINWFDENVEEVISTEQRLYCDNVFLQGQIDMIAKIKDMPGNTLVDIKSSLKYSKTWPLQTAAYQYLCSQNDIEITDRLIIQVKKDSTFEPYIFQFEDYHEQKDMFMGMLRAHFYFS